jgi:mRNA interferase MazF
MEDFLIQNQKENDFADWAKLKSTIHFHHDENKIYFKNREIWWASLGVNIGKEENGKNGRFERPVLILNKINKYTLIIVPLSSKIKQDRFHYQLFVNNRFESVLIFQVRTISSKRLSRKIGCLDKISFQEVKDKINSIFAGN